MRRWFQAAAAMLAALSVLLTPGTGGHAHAQAGGCSFAVNGQDISDFGESTRALEIDANERLQIAVILMSARQAVGEVTAEVDIGPVVRKFAVVAAPRSANADWNGTLDLSAHQKRAVGIQRMVLTTSGGCQGVLWFKLSGRSPFTTVFGLTALVLLVAGGALLVWGVRRAARGRHGIAPGVVGGVGVGMAAAVFAQELAFSPLANSWLLLWMSLPVVVGGVLTYGLARKWAADHPDEDEDEGDDYDISDASFAAEEDEEDEGVAR